MATQAMTPVMLSSIVVLRNTFNRRFSMESLFKLLNLSVLSIPMFHPLCKLCVKIYRPLIRQ